MKKTLIFLICIAVLSLSSCAGKKLPAIQPEASGVRTTEAVQESGSSAKTVVTKSGADSTLSDKPAAKTSVKLNNQTEKSTKKPNTTTGKKNVTLASGNTGSPTMPTIINGAETRYFKSIQEYGKLVKTYMNIPDKTHMIYPVMVKNKKTLSGSVDKDTASFSGLFYDDLEEPTGDRMVTAFVWLKPYKKENFEKDLVDLGVIGKNSKILFDVNPKTGLRYGYWTGAKSTLIFTWEDGYYTYVILPRRELTLQEIRNFLPRCAFEKVKI